LLPVAALLPPVDVAVVARIDVAAVAAAGDEAAATRPTTAHHAAFVGSRHTRRGARDPIGHPRGLRPIVTTLHVRGTPAPVDACTLSGLPVGAGARVVGVRGAARPVRTVRRSAAC